MTRSSSKVQLASSCVTEVMHVLILNLYHHSGKRSVDMPTGPEQNDFTTTTVRAMVKKSLCHKWFFNHKKFSLPTLLFSFWGWFRVNKQLILSNFKLVKHIHTKNHYDPQTVGHVGQQIPWYTHHFSGKQSKGKLPPLQFILFIMKDTSFVWFRLNEMESDITALELYLLYLGKENSYSVCFNGTNRAQNGWHRFRAIWTMWGVKVTSHHTIKKLMFNSNQHKCLFLRQTYFFFTNIWFDLKKDRRR